MPAPSYLRRIAVTALLVCAVLAGWSNSAAARPIDDPSLHTTDAAANTIEPRAVSTGGGSDWTLPIMAVGAVVLVLAGTVAYSHRARPSRRRATA
jgi:hypothetical protein